MENPIIKPDIPYKGTIPGGLVPGRMCRIQGVSHPDVDRFNINFQVGPRPSDDTALHISVRHKQGYIARNSYVNEEWGEEMGEGELTIGPAESWEIIILIDQNEYKIAVNGQHFTEFPHRVPFSQVTNLLIDGEVTITLISWEGITGLGDGENVKKISEADTQSQLTPQGNYGAPQGGYDASQGNYGPPQGNYGPPQGSYGPPQQGGYFPQGYGPGQGGGYGPPPPPGSQPESGFDNFLGGAQTLLAGAIKSGAASALIGKIMGGGSDTQRGYEHNNAKYGIYPDLPQDMNLNLNQGQQQPQGPVQKLLAGLLASSGQQQQQQQPGTGTTGTQQGQVDYAALITNLLSGNQQSKVSQTHGAPQGPETQQGGPDIGTFLSGLLSSHNQQTGSQAPPGGQIPPVSQPQSGGDIGTFLSGLLSNHSQQPANQQPGGQQQPAAQPHGVDIGGLLSGFLSGNATRPIQETGTHNPSPYSGATQPTASQQQPDLGSMLSGLLSGGSHSTAGHPASGGTTYPGSGPGAGTQQSQGIDLSSLLSSLLGTQGGVHPPYGGNTPYGGPAGGNEPYFAPSSGNQPFAPSGGNQPFVPSGGNQPFAPSGGNQPFVPSGGNQPFVPSGGNQSYGGPTQGPQPYSGSTGGRQSQSSGNPSRASQGNSDQGYQRQGSASKAADAKFEDVSDQLEREMSREGYKQNNAERSKQGGQGNEQYGYYPHPPEQQRGPIENLLSGFLSGGGQHQPANQQPHMPQFGGGESIGGLGSMGGLLQNFAGQILHPRDGNQRQNY